MQNDQALSIARATIQRAAARDNAIHGTSPYAVETREVLATLEQLQSDLATGVLVYAKEGD
jgi:hypothetical protein